MTLQRDKIDGNALETNDSHVIANELTKIAEKFSSAHAENRPGDAALLEADYRNMFEKWCTAEKAAKNQIKDTLTHQRTLLDLKFNWCDELSKIVDIPESVSKSQADILKNSELVPRNWAHARDAIQLMPDFRLSVSAPFERQIRVIFECLDALAAALAINQLYIEQMQKGLDHPSWKEFRESFVSKYQKKIQEYLGSLAELEALDE